MRNLRVALYSAIGPKYFSRGRPAESIGGHLITTYQGARWRTHPWALSSVHEVDGRARNETSISGFVGGCRKSLCHAGNEWRRCRLTGGKLGLSVHGHRGRPGRIEWRRRDCDVRHHTDESWTDTAQGHSCSRKCRIRSNPVSLTCSNASFCTSPVGELPVAGGNSDRNCCCCPVLLSKAT
jgi:hypothetical protein